MASRDHVIDVPGHAWPVVELASCLRGLCDAGVPGMKQTEDVLASPLGNHDLVSLVDGNFIRGWKQARAEMIPHPKVFVKGIGRLKRALTEIDPADQGTVVIINFLGDSVEIGSDVQCCQVKCSCLVVAFPVVLRGREEGST